MRFFEADIRAAEVAGIAGVSFLLLAGADRAGPGLPATALRSLAIQLLLSVLALAVATRIRRPTRETLGLAPSRLRARQTLWLAASTLGLSHALYTVLELSGWSDASSLGALGEQLDGASLPALGLGVLGLALAPSLGEELLCRGLLQRTLLQHTGPGWAIAISSGTFAALHPDPVHAIFAAPLGVQLGLAAYVGNSTRTSMICHLANNTVAIGLAAAGGLIPEGSPASAALGLAIWGAGWGALWRDLPRNPGGSERSGLQYDGEPVDR